MPATALVQMTEAELLSNVLGLAEILKYRCVHMRPGMNRRGRWSTAMSGTQAAGWPDLFMVRREHALAVELKSERGRTTPEQLDWLACLCNAGIETFVWRPADWLDGTIESVLRRGS
jgi:hypothetical protein